MKRRFFAIVAVLALAAVTFAHPARAGGHIVTTTANGGAGSLRAAIQFANANPGTTIIFDGGVFPGVIVLTSRLPKITGENTTIDGVGFGVVIDGSFLPNVPASQGLRVRANGTVIQGLTIQDFPGDGIRIQPEGNGNDPFVVQILDNVIKRAFDGIRVSGQGQNNVLDVTISGNTIFESADDGLFVRGSSTTGGNNTINIVIDDNNIGKSQGTKNPGFTGDGIRIFSGFKDSAPNDVTAVISNNIIHDSDDQGIVVKGAGGDGNTSDNILDVTIIGNRVRSSGLQGDGSGIVVLGGHRPAQNGGSNNIVTFLIDNNRVGSSKKHGIFTSTKHGISIGGGQADTASRGGSHEVSGTVSNNTVSRNASHGIKVSGGRSDGNLLDGIVIEGNDVKNNGKRGIFVSGSNGNGVKAGSNNTITNLSVRGNTTRGNLGDGIGARAGNSAGGTGNSVSFADITDNVSIGNGVDGIRIRPGIPGSGATLATATPISGNRASRNGQDGFDIDSDNYVLSNNRAGRNAADGINAEDGANFNGGGNFAKGNAACNSPGFCF